MSTRSAAPAWEALFRAQVTAMRRFEAARDFAPLRSREYDVLFNLAQMGGSARQHELNERLLISQPSLSRMVDRLVAAGHLQRQECSADGRGVVVALTTAGAQLQRTIGRRHVRHITEIIDGALNEDEQRTLIELTNKVRASATVEVAEAPREEGTP
ncbi:MAG TPA: MarR family winged helix-turn-helix transcriptional regulator [Beutenbergiaceae bacterium]|nr:MarR family winged helix-turn-helix transcriptional regulator [Beutenbergiaceae bacterium]